MKITHYKDIPPDPVGEEDTLGVTIRWVISEKDGAPNFSMRVFTIEPGGHSPYHQHPWEHEVFILKGRGVLVQGDEKSPFSKGDAVFVPPGKEHQFRNTSKKKLEFICLIPNL